VSFVDPRKTPSNFLNIGNTNAAISKRVVLKVTEYVAAAVTL
jgi:hypothetical protein